MSKLHCDCGEPSGRHHWLGCGVPIPTQRERDADVRARNAGPQLLKALRAMINTHGMHGPCRHNSCRDCRHVYAMAVRAVKDAEKED